MEAKLLEGGRDSGGWVWNIVGLSMCILVLYKLVVSRIRRKRLPPGPKGLPIVGSLLSLSALPHHYFLKLAAQYGPIVSLQIGRVPTVVISSPEVAKEILRTKDQVWASRPYFMVFEHFSYGNRDIALSPYGPSWRHARKIGTLELLTPQRIAWFQDKRQREYQFALKGVMEASREGRALNMRVMLSSLFTNLVTQMMWNKRHFIPQSSNSAEATAFQEIIRESFKLFSAINIPDYFPFLKLVSIDFQGYYKRAREVRKKFDDFVEAVIKEHRTKKYDESKNGDKTYGNAVEDFVDVLLRLSKDAEANGEEEVPVEMLKGTLFDMVIGGTETSTTSTEWILAELIRHPKIMKKLQDELDSVVGRNRLVNETDIPHMKYLETVVKEGFRLHPPTPFMIPHESTQDSVISGYFVPAGTTAFVNVYAIQRDPNVWERPLEFDPDRFFSSNIELKGQDFELLPFGSGRRMCPAVNLALISVQATIATLTHAFSWSLQDGEKAADLDMSEVMEISCPRKVALTLVATPRLAAHVICPEV